jgi:hypothetical protein
MKRLLFVALVAFAAWYGWHHYSELRQAGSHQVLVINRSGHAIERLRIHAGDQTVVVEVLEDGAQAKQPFRSQRDSPFDLTWQVRGAMGDRTWTGGNFSHGPILFTYRFEFRDGDGVIWSSEKLPTK